MKALLDFLSRLNELKVWFRIERIRDETIMVLVAAPGEYWEVEFFATGEIEVEVFRSNGKIEDSTRLAVLFEKYTERGGSGRA